MNEFTNITNGKELIVRKRIASFLEKVLRYIGYDFNHNRYKKIIYSEESVSTPLEEKIKNYYDAYYYLISNHKMPLTRELLSKFFYILNGNIIDQSMLYRVVTKYFKCIDLPPLESIIEFHLHVYKELIEVDKPQKLVVTLMLFNYLLLKHNIPTIQILQSDLPKYEIALNESIDGNKTSIYSFFIEQIKKAKFQDKKFYVTLKPIKSIDIINQILSDQEILINEYKIKKIYLFGSFSNNCSRIDSDIDLLIAFSLDLTYEEKKEYIDKISNHYFFVFNRYIDITEISEYLNDEFLKEITKVKKIL